MVGHTDAAYDWDVLVTSWRHHKRLLAFQHSVLDQVKRTLQDHCVACVAVRCLLRALTFACAVCVPLQVSDRAEVFKLAEHRKKLGVVS